jgi:hypothetical protein
MKNPPLWGRVWLGRMRRGAANYRRADAAANKSSTAAGSRSSATTRMNHRRTVSLSAPMSVARYRTGPRSASTVRRSLSTGALSIFRLARAFASTAIRVDVV